ncbi:caspase family protein [Pedobacter sp. WC2501]|uniref:caspase family protein n=1 Tax=Pedobacter sp. WC2501 TaxID=3461400 RepID=UPI0040465D1F
MTKGISLHIGLNYVDPIHYSGWDGKLNAAEYDANDMYLIAKSQGIQASKLIRAAATRNAVISTIRNAATILTNNDLFVITYSGHGGQVPDVNGDEDDSLDETWCLFDGQLIDDELHELWALFQKGVRILVISDSCHSGTITKMAMNFTQLVKGFTRKFMPDEIAATTYFNHQEFYDNILKKIIGIDPENIKASVKLISGCQDNQYSYDGPFNGQFTGALKKVWNGGKFSGNYLSFHKQIMNLLPVDQTPNYYNIGQQNLPFDNQKPFLI